jgi:hypothetical protein
MATTTPNYGWAVPTSTDLVKDGATAIETLGDAIDASMNTALGTKKAGMVLLNTTSFSAVASQAVPSVFSATYDTYLVQIMIDVASSSGVLQYKLRSGATDSSVNYYSGLFRWSYGGTTGINQQVNNGSAATILELNGTSTAIHLSNLHFGNPFAAKQTTIAGQSVNPDGWGTVHAGLHTQTVSYDGFNLIASAGNITGRVSVYGYNK